MLPLGFSIFDVSGLLASRWHVFHFSCRSPRWNLADGSICLAEALTILPDRLCFVVVLELNLTLLGRHCTLSSIFIPCSNFFTLYFTEGKKECSSCLLLGCQCSEALLLQVTSKPSTCFGFWLFWECT